jgi:hypothetical protein
MAVETFKHFSTMDAAQSIPSGHNSEETLNTKGIGGYNPPWLISEESWAGGERRLKPSRESRIFEYPSHSKPRVGPGVWGYSGQHL